MKTLKVSVPACLIVTLSLIASCRKIPLERTSLSKISSYGAMSNLANAPAGALQVLTIAGSTFGFTNGQGAAAQFKGPGSVAVDAAGTMYIADSANHAIRKILSTGLVSTLAGSGSPGFVNAQGSAAQFKNPTGVAVDGNGNVFVADKGNHVIRKITPDGTVTTLAGSGIPDFTNGQGTSAQFNSPSGVAIDINGNIIVADAGNQRIRKITQAGLASSLAGNGTVGGGNGAGGFAQFNFPSGVAVGTNNNIYVADAGNHKIRKISAGLVTTLAGGGTIGSTAGYLDAADTAARFNQPAGVAADGNGNVYVADRNNNRIRNITPAGVVSTYAGTGVPDFLDGTPSVAKFKLPTGIAADAGGNIFVADAGNLRVRKIGLVLTVSTFAGSGNIGFWGGGESDGPLLAAAFRNPSGMAFQSFGYSAGSLVVCDLGNSRIRYILPPNNFYSKDRWVQTGAGSTYGYRDMGAWYTSLAQFASPEDLAIDDSGKVFIADAGNSCIRIIDNKGVSTFAGKGQSHGFADGHDTAARFNVPRGIAIAPNRVLYVADMLNNRIRKITPDGNVTTVAGSGVEGFQDGDAATAKFNQPTDVIVDNAGNLYVADYNNHRIRKITPQGIVSTVAGSGNPAFANGTGTAASFSGPRGLAMDAAGNILVADFFNNMVRKITPSGVVSTVAGNGNYGYIDGPSSVAEFTWPTAILIDPASGALYVSDSYNHRIRKIQ